MGAVLEDMDSAAHRIRKPNPGNGKPQAPEDRALVWNVMTCSTTNDNQ
jgi:hypothetical protein